MSTVIPELLTIDQAVEDPRCPWTSRKKVHNAIQGARPIKDTAGNILKPGDPELLSVFVRPYLSQRSPIFIDVQRLGEVLDRRRIGTVEEAA